MRFRAQLSSTVLPCQPPNFHLSSKNARQRPTFSLNSTPPNPFSPFPFSLVSLLPRMCGIFGVCGYEGDIAAFRPKAVAMSKKLRSRGPDWSGVWTTKDAILCHERLAIVGVGQCHRLYQLDSVPSGVGIVGRESQDEQGREKRQGGCSPMSASLVPQLGWPLAQSAVREAAALSSRLSSPACLLASRWWARADRFQPSAAARPSARPPVSRSVV